jgi:hypothetical protein
MPFSYVGCCFTAQNCTYHKNVTIVTSYVVHRPCSYSLWQGHCAMTRSCRQRGGNAHRNIHWQHRGNCIPKRLYKITTVAHSKPMWHIYYWLYAYIKMFWCEAAHVIRFVRWKESFFVSLWVLLIPYLVASCYFCPYNQGCNKLGHFRVAPLCFCEYWDSIVFPNVSEVFFCWWGINVGQYIDFSFALPSHVP